MGSLIRAISSSDAKSGPAMFVLLQLVQGTFWLVITFVPSCFRAPVRSESGLRALLEAKLFNLVTFVVVGNRPHSEVVAQLCRENCQNKAK